ncbi:hypothetical protein F0L68_24815 [Solihabitans fulvus]|uniref:Uncharacterized protein n=1 Tax=Solihabitans fulvus TaxID=1892852 RepID=A0A5B2X2M7_9PSEU|nr:hypothetical protein [Solihabitans fulvus]KAA2257524.1 hypothetical protein F0L68_24815 [Solihabitans fulvus]
MRPRTPHLLVVATLALGTITLASSAGSGHAAGGPAVIDLSVSANEPTVKPGQDTGTQTFTVTNQSSSDGISNVVFRYTTPIFVNIAAPLPGGPGILGCAKRYTNPDRFVPEVLECTLAAINAGASTTITVALNAPTGTPPTPKVSSWGTASALPVPGGDTVTDPADAIITPGVNIDGAPPSPEQRTSPDLYLRPPTGAVYTDGTDGTLTFSIGNDKAAGPATQPLRLVFSLPPYVKFHHVDPVQGLYTRCTGLFDDPADPAVAQIWDCAVAPPVGLPPGTEVSTTVDITARPGGPSGNVWSSAVATTTGSDHNQNLATGIFAPGVQIIR